MPDIEEIKSLEGVLIANYEIDSPKKIVLKDKKIHGGNVIGQGRNKKSPLSDLGSKLSS